MLSAVGSVEAGHPTSLGCRWAQHAREPRILLDAPTMVSTALKRGTGSVSCIAIRKSLKTLQKKHETTRRPRLLTSRGQIFSLKGVGHHRRRRFRSVDGRRCLWLGKGAAEVLGGPLLHSDCPARAGVLSAGRLYSRNPSIASQRQSTRSGGRLRLGGQRGRFGLGTARVQGKATKMYLSVVADLSGHHSDGSNNGAECVDNDVEVIQLALRPTGGPSGIY